MYIYLTNVRNKLLYDSAHQSKYWGRGPLSQIEKQPQKRVCISGKEIFWNLKVMLHWSTCNADSQGMFLARICRHVTLWNRFQKLSTRCSTANIAKNRWQRAVTLEYFFRATSYHCKLALQVDQCNTTFRPWRKGTRPQLKPSYKIQICMAAVAKRPGRLSSQENYSIFWLRPHSQIKIAKQLESYKLARVGRKFELDQIQANPIKLEQVGD